MVPTSLVLLLIISELCGPGQGWWAKKKKCVSCGKGMFKATEGSVPCSPCPEYYTDIANGTACGNSE